LGSSNIGRDLNIDIVIGTTQKDAIGLTKYFLAL
jgi:hypothetical protein